MKHPVFASFNPCENKNKNWNLEVPVNTSWLFRKIIRILVRKIKPSHWKLYNYRSQYLVLLYKTFRKIPGKWDVELQMQKILNMSWCCLTFSLSAVKYINLGVSSLKILHYWIQHLKNTLTSSILPAATMSAATSLATLKLVSKIVFWIWSGVLCLCTIPCQNSKNDKQKYKWQ